MKNYELSVSGNVVVEVQANSVEEAKELALNTTVAGELYNWVFEEVEEIA